MKSAQTLFYQRHRVNKIIDHCEPAFRDIVRRNMLLSTGDIRRLAKTVPGICYITESLAMAVLESYCQDC